MDELQSELNNQPVVPQTPQSPVQMSESISPKRFGPKFIVVVVAVIVVVVGAFGAIWWWGNHPLVLPHPVASPTPDPTADWKTYTNTQYGFEVKIPQDWMVGQLNDTSSDQLTYFLSPERKASNDENQKICSGVKTGVCITEGVPWDMTFSVSNKTGIGVDELKYGDIHTQTINGIMFKVYNVLGMVLGESWETELNGKFYRFDLFDYDNNLVNNKILSTFKFTK